MSNRTSSSAPAIRAGLSSQAILESFSYSGNTKNPIAIDLMAILTVDPTDKEILDLAGHLTLPGIIARNDNPFVERAPVPADFDQNHYLVLGRVPETGALWTLSDENNLSHIFCLGITGGGKSSWALMLMAEILTHENRGITCPYQFHQRLLSQ